MANFTVISTRHLIHPTILCSSLQPRQYLSAHPCRYMADLANDTERKEHAAMFERVLLFMPLYHTYGYSISINTAIAGGCSVLMGGFSFRVFLHAIQKHKVMRGG